MWSQDFKEFIASLTAHGVEYLVVGGYAVGLHGYPRYTGDLDIWVRADADNATRLLAALDAFGFGGAGIVTEDFTREGRVLQLGRPPFRIDVIRDKRVQAQIFLTDSLRARRSRVDLDGVPLHIVQRGQFRNPRRAGAPASAVVSQT